MTSEDVKVLVAVASATMSAVALILSGLAYLLGRQNAVAARRPVVVFEWTDSRGWCLCNPGNGPALNVRVSVRGKRTGWTEEVTTPTLPSGASFELAWIGKLNAWMLGAEYDDFAGSRYTTISQHDLNLTLSGFRLKEFIAHDENYVPGKNAVRHWNARNISTDKSLT